MRSSLRSIRSISCRDEALQREELNLVMAIVSGFARRGGRVVARVGLLVAIPALVVAGAAVPSARAVLHLDVTGGTIQPIPISIPNFLAGGPDAELGSEIAGVITNDLKRSGLFQPLDPASFTDPPKTTATVPNFGDWRVLNAQALVIGGVARQPDGRLRAEFRLWDVLAGQQMA